MDNIINTLLTRAYDGWQDYYADFESYGIYRYDREYDGYELTLKGRWLVFQYIKDHPDTWRSIYEVHSLLFAHYTYIDRASPDYGKYSKQNKNTSATR